MAWARRAMWAPAAVRKDGRYYFFFAANDVHEGEVGGIGVAVSDRPEGPYRDLLGKPLIGEIVNGAQPIDQFVYEHGGEYYMYYGGWGHCNVVRLKEDFTGIRPFDDRGALQGDHPRTLYRGAVPVRTQGKILFHVVRGSLDGPRLFGGLRRVGFAARAVRNASERSCGRTPPWLREPDITP